ncbi:hypothetical protein BHE74_00000777 [Ensete ventricosum]|nr:hypothetical protein BHE74_00000777 [Ensete ventricosum]
MLVDDIAPLWMPPLRVLPLPTSGLPLGIVLVGATSASAISTCSCPYRQLWPRATASTSDLVVFDRLVGGPGHGLLPLQAV